MLPGTIEIGLVLLWIAALLTLYTGWDYMKAGSSTCRTDEADEGPLFRLGARARRPRRGGALPSPEVATVGELIAWLKAAARTTPTLSRTPRIIRAAIDKTHVSHETPIAGAREIAFFPPMTGG